MADRPTFSPFWHRVRALRPRLRPHVQITRQHYRGERWHVVHDPSSNQFYRLNPIAHEFVGLLDGRRTVEEVWELCLTRHADAAPTQQEALQLIAQLYGANLLSVDASPEIEQLLRRGRDRLKKKAIGQVVGIMYFKIRLFNPDRFVAAVEPVLRPLISRLGLVLWAALVLFALLSLAPHARTLMSDASSAIAPSNWGWLSVVFILTKAIHELGHAVILKRFGGQVPECGVMLLVLFPAPYVDASAAWTLENKWRRIAVGAGGMLFELCIAAIAALVWVGTLGAEGSLTHQLAYNAMFIASVSTVLFNANPLMRFDGYYMLSDLIEIPNLMQRSQRLIQHFFKRYCYRLKNEPGPTTSPSERWILAWYGVLSLGYRVVLFLSITLHVMGVMFGLGLLLALWTAAMWFFLPAGKFVHWIASSPALHDRRLRAVGVSLLLGLVVIVPSGLVPFPDYRRASGVVEARLRTGVYFGVDGFVEEAFVRPGERVSAGQKLARLSNPELDQRIKAGRAQIAKVRSLMLQATREQPVAVDVYEAQLVALEEQLGFLLSRRAALEVLAPHAGVIVGADPDAMVGAYVREGQAMCELVDDTSLRIVASLGQRENSWAISAQRGDLDLTARARFLSRAHVSVPCEVEEVIEAGQRTLAHGALAYGGGGTIQTQSDDRTGRQASTKQFEVLLAAEQGAGWRGSPGERVALRFTLPARPLALQWADRLHKLVQSRVKL
jgi:putative peptide zinc metalloprotease protein